ncbi:MAG: hypothetical protein WC470_03380 [Candidatus Paceibacterota bacterium]
MFISINGCRELYRLGFIPGADLALSLKAGKGLMDSLQIDYGLINEKIEQCHLGSFLANQGFGFDGAFKITKEDSKNIEFRIPLPKAISENVSSWKRIQAIVQTMVLFTHFVRPAYRQGLDPLGRSQLLSLYVVADYQNNRYGIGGDYSVELCDWLENKADNSDLDNIKRAMEQTYSYIYGRPYQGGNFLTYLTEDGCLFLECPTDCVTYAKPHRTKITGREYDSSGFCHPGEILVTLSGLFALYDIAGKAIYGSSY